MSDVLLTVCEGHRVLHDGKFFGPGKSFKIAEDHAQTLLDEGVCEKGKGKVSEPDDAGPPPETPAPAATSTDGKGPNADEIKKSVPDSTDAELAALLEAEEQREKPRKSVQDKIKAEQKKRADAAS